MEPVSALTQGVDHVGLTVSNLESSRRFFCECLGWKTIGEVPSYPAAFVSDGVTRLTLWQVDQASDPVGFDRRKNIGLHHLALKVADLATLHEVFTRASNWPGVEVEFAPQPVGQGPRIHCMLREPGGVRLELVCTPAS
jgi:catechol 2,3-dioxygenase-like lactoylglutathione lyase family enzyme